MELNIFSGNATDVVLEDGVTVAYWRDVVADILGKIKLHSKRVHRIGKSSPSDYNSRILDSCVHSVGALSSLTDKEDDLFSYKEKLQARCIILESQNLCRKLDDYIE